MKNKYFNDKKRLKEYLIYIIIRRERKISLRYFGVIRND